MDRQLQLRISSFADAAPDLQRILEGNDGLPVRKDGKTYLLAGHTVYSWEDIPETQDLTRQLLSGAGKGCAGSDTEESAWKAVLNGSGEPSLLKRFGITDRAERCVLLFRPLQNCSSRVLCELVPLEAQDRIVPMENGDAILILNMEKRTADEAYEYAAAVSETMESEAGIACRSGVGRPAKSLASLPGSCRDALTAVETGIRHHLRGRVFVYDRLKMERMTDLIPPESAKRFREEVIPPGAEKVLTDELIETIRVFFGNDLNLSTTARQLFIHRNTLLYRMDKIRKATGLDLRRFEDAAVFRIMMDIPGEGINE